MRRALPSWWRGEDSGPEAIPLRDDGLQLDEHRNFQEHFWVAERAAWIVFCLVLLLAIAGFGGSSGPASQDEIAVAGSRVVYPTISRWTAPDTLHVRFGPGAPSRTLLLDPAFSEAFEIQTIEPQPVEATATPDGLQLRFAVDGNGSASVFLNIQSRTIGRVKYDFAIDGGAPVSVSTLILP